jgi:transposase-like protein
MEASELKRELAKGRGRGGRYPAALRDAVVEYAARAKRSGKNQRAVAEELGMSLQTLCYWRALARSKGGLLPVTILAEPQPEVTVECGPLRVRGLDVGGVAELLRRLA